jgi:SAM-dependent methyltransferase
MTMQSAPSTSSSTYAAPAQFIANMRRCLRPGGLLILAMPKFRSAINDIPNFVFNAPPHHLSWWSERALQDARAIALRSKFESLERTAAECASPTWAIGWAAWRRSSPASSIFGTANPLARRAALGLLWRGGSAAVLCGTPRRAASGGAAADRAQAAATMFL